MTSIIVLIIQYETKTNNPNIEYLKNLFSNSIFQVEVFIPPKAPTQPTNSTLSNYDYIDKYNTEQALNYLNGKYPINNSILIKDSSVANLTADQMASYLTQALALVPQTDLLFLCKWSDYCNKLTYVVNNINEGSSLAWTTHPSANQAIYYNYLHRENIYNGLVNSSLAVGDYFNQSISQGQIKASTFTPNLINYDILVATSNNDYSKLNECVPISDVVQSSSVGVFIWFAILVAIILLIGWALIGLGPRYKIK